MPPQPPSQTSTVTSPAVREVRTWPQAGEFTGAGIGTKRRILKSARLPRLHPPPRAQGPPELLGRPPLPAAPGLRDPRLRHELEPRRLHVRLAPERRHLPQRARARSLPFAPGVARVVEH